MKKLLFVICISVILLSSCEDFLAWLFSGSGGNFWARDLTKNTGDYNYFYRITAELLAEGRYCEVYVETTSGVTEATAKRIADEYDKNIYLQMIGAFGLDFYKADTKKTYNTIQLATDYYTGGGDKLTILLFDIKDGYQKGVRDSYVAGYFTPYDFFSYDNSNRRAMIYIDTYPAFAIENGFEEAYSTLAHELQHLMNFTTTLERRLVYDAEGELTDINLMDTWIDEGLASAAEWVYKGKHLDYRLKWYLDNGSVDKDGKRTITSLIDRGNNFFVWDNRDHNDKCPTNCNDPEHSQYAALDDYATVCLFFQWLRIQSSKGTAIYKDIIGSDKGNYLAVTDAADLYYKNDWGRLLGDWLAANYINSPSGPYGYGNNTNDSVLRDITAHYFPVTGANARANLYPGEGVYSKINSYYPAPTNSGNIRYSLLSGSNIVSGPIYSGALLTYNVDLINYDTKDKDGNITTPIAVGSGIVTGVAADVSVVVPAQGRSVAGAGLTGPYRIGAGDVQRGWFRDFSPDDVIQLQNNLTLREE